MHKDWAFVAFHANARIHPTAVCPGGSSHPRSTGPTIDASKISSAEQNVSKTKFRPSREKISFGRF